MTGQLLFICFFKVEKVIGYAMSSPTLGASISEESYATLQNIIKS